MTSAGLLLSLSLAGVASPRRSTRSMPLSLRSTYAPRQTQLRPSPVPRGSTPSLPRSAPPLPSKVTGLQAANAALAFTPAAPLIAFEKPLEIIGSTIGDWVFGSHSFGGLFSEILQRRQGG